MIKLTEGGVSDMWTNNESPEIKALSYAVQVGVSLIVKYADQTRCFSDVDKLAEDTLDYFAVESRTMYYSQDLPIETKRRIIKNTLKWYTHAGTPSAVSELIDVVFGGGELTEWMDFEEPPYGKYLFDITTEALLTPDIIDRMQDLIETVKNARSHIRRVKINRDIKSGMHFAGINFSTQESIISNHLREDTAPRQTEAFAGLMPTESHMTVPNHIAYGVDASGGSTVGSAIESRTDTTVTNRIKQTVDAPATPAYVAALADTERETIIQKED